MLHSGTNPEDDRWYGIPGIVSFSPLLPGSVSVVSDGASPCIHKNVMFSLYKAVPRDTTNDLGPAPASLELIVSTWCASGGDLSAMSQAPPASPIRAAFLLENNVASHSLHHVPLPPPPNRHLPFSRTSLPWVSFKLLIFLACLSLPRYWLII